MSRQRPVKRTWDATQGGFGYRSVSRYPPKKRARLDGVKTSYKGSMVPNVHRGYQINSKEQKVSDVSPASISVDTGGVFTLLHAPQPGTDMTNRIGRKTCPRSIQIRAQVNVTPAATGTPVVCAAQTARWILFVDFQPSGAAPAVTDLLTAASPFAHINLNNRDRFKILRDKIFPMGPVFFSDTATQSYITGENMCKSFKLFKRLQGIETIFNTGSAGTIADISSGALFSLWIGSVAAGTNDCVAVQTSRVRFDDA